MSDTSPLLPIYHHLSDIFPDSRYLSIIGISNFHPYPDRDPEIEIRTPVDPKLTQGHYYQLTITLNKETGWLFSSQIGEMANIHDPNLLIKLETRIKEWYHKQTCPTCGQTLCLPSPAIINALGDGEQ